AIVTLYGVDLAIVSRQATVAPFHLTVPPVARSPEFHQEKTQHYVYGKPAVGPALRDRYEWPSKIIYPSMRANTGMVTCYGIPLEATHSRVVGSDQPQYRGLVFLAGGAGRADLLRWRPNAITVHVTGAAPGDRLVYDMNADPGWRANAIPVESWQGLVAVPLRGGNETIELSYRPPGLIVGLLLFTATLTALAFILSRDRRRRSL